MLFIFLGYAHDPDGFTSNFYAELVGIFAGAIVAYVLIDRILERQRRRNWKKIRAHYLDTAASKIWQVIIRFYARISTDMAKDSVPLQSFVMFMESQPGHDKNIENLEKLHEIYDLLRTFGLCNSDGNGRKFQLVA